MIKLQDILSPSRVAIDRTNKSQKRILEQISSLISADEPSLTMEEIFEAMTKREQLGSTGIGHGIAIPHARIDNLSHTTAAFIRTETPVDILAPDAKSVDLFFGLLVPMEATDEHLQLLSKIAHLFQDKQFTTNLRNAASNEELFALLIEHDNRLNASEPTIRTS